MNAGPEAGLHPCARCARMQATCCLRAGRAALYAELREELGGELERP